MDEWFIVEPNRGPGWEAPCTAQAVRRARGVGVLHRVVERHREPARRLHERAGFGSRDRHLMTRRLHHRGPGMAA